MSASTRTLGRPLDSSALRAKLEGAHYLQVSMPLILQQPMSKSTCRSLLPEGFPINPNESTLLQETCGVKFGSRILFVSALLFCLRSLRSA
jgi:hypothetical protein